jgi:glycosyltransferase involved in cell wall biosynthesis
MRIVHLSSAHSRDDTRIFVKQCRSLALQGHDVTLVVADDKGDECKDGVRIVDVGVSPGRLNRMFKTTQRVFDKAVDLDAAVYHLHDPELIPFGLRLKQRQKKVIFDSHEDLPKQLQGKPYLGRVSQWVLPQAVALYERYACSRFNGIVAATPFIREKFLSINRHTVDVNNFPLLGELGEPVPWTEKRKEVCYIGGLSSIRGVRELVRACESLQSQARLNLAGSFFEPGLRTEVASYPGWARVNELGYLDRRTVREVLMRSMAGLVTLHPTINHCEALPVKMFEYMAAGIPVIASDIPLWRGIIERNECGVCVDPFDSRAIAGAIDDLLAHPERARRMGQNGRRAVVSKYNWAIEEEKLCRFYAQLA